MIYGRNKKYLQVIFLFVIFLFLIGCAGQSIKTDDSVEKDSQSSLDEEENGIKGTVLIFTEREAGSRAESFTTRIFVSDDYLHMSDSYSPADFVLFNRKQRTIYNVTQDDKSIFVINDKPHNLKPPINIKYEGQSQPSSAIPKIDGRQATHYRYYANDKHCYDSVVLGEDFLPDVLAAMREFRQVLANEHAATINKMPDDMLDACDLSVNIFHATKHMENGFPVREWDRRGYQRFLKDYRQGVVVPEEVFVLPKDFSQYSLEDLQKGVKR